MDVHFGKTSADYAEHRQGFPAQFFERLREQGVAKVGSRVLDLGAGTGALSIPLAEGSAVVTALDTEPEQLKALEQRAKQLALAISTVCAPAEDTGLAAHSFDWITAAQCWHWFDPARVLREVRRLLVPGGRLLICSNDWLPEPGSVPFESEALIQAHNPAWSMGGGDGRHPEWRRDLEQSGFLVLHEGHEHYLAKYTHEAWRGRIRASAGIAASLPPADVERFDREHTHLLSKTFPQDPMEVPHRFAYCLSRYDD